MAPPIKTRIILPSKKRKNLFYVGFILINLFLSSYYLDVWLTPNAASRAISVLSLYENKSLEIDKYKDYAGDMSMINNHYYSNKAPLSALVIYPVYWLCKTVGLPDLKDATLKEYPIYIWEHKQPNYDGRNYLVPKTSSILIIGDILCGAVPFVIILLLSLFAIKKTSSKVSPVAVVMMSFYASFLFAYAGTFSSHILSGFLALIGYILIKNKNYAVSGLMVGLAMAIEFPVGALAPVWALLIYLNEKKISKPLLFGAGLIPGLLIILYFNHLLTGSITKTPYSYELYAQKQSSQDVGFYYPTISAFWGLIFSTYRGVLYYTPVLLLMIWYGVKFGYEDTFMKVKDKMALVNSGIKNYLLVTVLAYLVLYSAYYQWPGGWTFGPRYLIPMVIILLYEGISFLSSRPV